MYPAQGNKVMHKYYCQRHKLFSKFDDGILLDEESWYSVTPEEIAIHHANRYKAMLGERHGIIIDGFCGAGGNLIQFAKVLPNVLVIGCDINEERLEMARNNARVYGVEHKCQFLKGDFLNILKTLRHSKVDAVFLSPPWGGVNYKYSPKYSLSSMKPNGFMLIEEVRKHLTPNIAFLAPRNIDEDELINSLSAEHPYLELEKNFVGTTNKKVKTITIYYGDLMNKECEIEEEVKREESGVSSAVAGAIEMEANYDSDAVPNVASNAKVINNNNNHDDDDDNEKIDIMCFDGEQEQQLKNGGSAHAPKRSARGVLSS